MRTAASQPDMGMSRPYDADSIDPTRNAISQNRHAFMQLAAAEGRITYPGKSYLLQALNGLPDELVDSMMDKVKGCSEVSLRSWMKCFDKMVEENVAPELIEGFLAVAETPTRNILCRIYANINKLRKVLAIRHANAMSRDLSVSIAVIDVAENIKEYAALADKHPLLIGKSALPGLTANENATIQLFLDYPAKQTLMYETMIERCTIDSDLLTAVATGHIGEISKGEL